VTVPTLRCTIDPAADDATSSELLVLGPSLGTTTSVWQPIVEAFRHSDAGRSLRILRYDLPGHGASPASREGFTVADIADAVLRLVDETGGGRFHYAGISLGGAAGLELALRFGHRLLSLTLICTDARIGTAESWAERGAQARSQGTASLVGGSAGRWFAPGFLDRDDERGARALTELTEVDDESYAECTDALAMFDVRSRLGSITVPTVTVSGEYDAVTTPADLAELARAIPGARSESIAGVAHLAVLENPARCAKIIADQVGVNTATSTPDVLAQGMLVRRAVLGDAHVDRQVAGRTAETGDFQDFITRYAWGDVWSRPGLTRRDRSIATLASLTTGGHDNEIAIHVRGALANGLSRAEISEVLLHTAIYAGVPAANGAFAILREVFAELDASTGSDRADDGSTPTSARHKESDDIDG
jgi:3-oxoadipate enol-lactonase/4-carboxymuconolactone decarboxylase